MLVAEGTTGPVCSDLADLEWDAELAGWPALSRDRPLPLAGRWLALSRAVLEVAD